MRCCPRLLMTVGFSLLPSGIRDILSRIIREPGGLTDFRSRTSRDHIS
jgi:hypothetical protein